MSFADAHAFAFSLAATLMVTIVIFRAGDGTLSVVPANEYDGDDTAIIGDAAAGAGEISEDAPSAIAAETIFHDCI